MGVVLNGKVVKMHLLILRTSCKRDETTGVVVGRVLRKEKGLPSTGVSGD